MEQVAVAKRLPCLPPKDAALKQATCTNLVLLLIGRTLITEPTCEVMGMSDGPDGQFTKTLTDIYIVT